jgi:dolichol kinase
MSRASIPGLQPRELDRSSSPQIPGIPRHVWGVRQLVDRLGVCEFRRRLLHMLPGLLPLLLLVIPHRDPWGPLLNGIVITLSLTLVTYAMIRERDFARPNEGLWHTTLLGYCAPVLAMLFLLPGRSELGLMTLGVVAFGDGSAALGGILMGGRRLPWNRRKTWAGLCCFLVAGTLGGTLNYWIDARPAVDIGVIFSIGAAAALTGAIAESLPFRSHDNLRVGVTAALTGLLMHTLLLGW